MRSLALLALAACTTDIEPQPRSRAPSVFDDVVGEPDSELRVEYGVLGCFGGSLNDLALTRRAGQWTLSGVTNVDCDNRRHVAVVISDEEAQALVDGLALLLATPETESGCRSTGQSYAHVEVRFGARHVAQALKSDGRCDGYVHADAVSHWADAALSPRPGVTLPATDEEKAALVRKWRGPR